MNKMEIKIDANINVEELGHYFEDNEIAKNIFEKYKLYVNERNKNYVHNKELIEQLNSNLKILRYFEMMLSFLFFVCLMIVVIIYFCINRIDYFILFIGLIPFFVKCIISVCNIPIKIYANELNKKILINQNPLSETEICFLNEVLKLKRKIIKETSIIKLNDMNFIEINGELVEVDKYNEDDYLQEIGYFEFEVINDYLYLYSFKDSIDKEISLIFTDTEVGIKSICRYPVVYKKYDAFIDTLTNLVCDYIKLNYIVTIEKREEKQNEN